MALNEFGAGFKIWAKDFASGVFGQVGKNFSAMSKQAENDAARMSAGLARIGKGAALMGAGFTLVKPMELAVRESSRLNKALAEVSTLTNEATFPLSQMKDLVKETAEQYGQESTIQAKALYQTISAGYGEAEQAAKMLETANKLAVGGVTEVDNAVDGLTNIMNTYKSANLEALDVSDAMFVAMKEGKTTIGELSSQIGRVAPGAEAMGIKFDEVLASISAVTSKGIDTAQTVSGLAAALGNINKPSKDAADEAKRLGIQFNAAALRSKGLKGFLDSITGSAKYNQDTMAKLFGSIEAFKTMTALSANESEKFNDVLAKMETRVGATDTAVAKMEKTFDHQAKRFKIIRQNILATIGDTVESMLAPVVKFLNMAGSAINKFINTLPPGVRKTIVGIVGGFGAFIGMAGGILVLSGAMKVLGVSIKGTILGFVKMMAVLVPVAILLAGMGVSVYAMYRAFKKNTGGITTDWQTMAKRVGLAWQGMMKIISGDSFSDELNKQLDQAENSGVRRFLYGFENFAERMRALWRGITVGFERGVDRLAQSSGMQRLKDSIQSIVYMFSSAGADSDIDILKRWEKQGEATGEKLASFGEVAFQAASNVLQLTREFLNFMSKVDVKSMKQGLDGLVETFSGMQYALVKVGELFQMIWKLVGSAVSGIQIFGAAVAEVLGMLVTGDFSQGMVETEKRVKEFDKIWNPEKYPEMRVAISPNITAGLGRREEDTRNGGLQRPPVMPMAVNVVQGLRDMQAENLKERQQALIKFVEGSEEMKRKGKDVEFSDLNQREQELVVQAIKDLGAKIDAMANRPINLELDGEKVAEQLKQTDTAQGVRDFSGSYGY